MYDAVRNGAYAIQASIGWRSLLFYIILVYMLVRFLWTYIKRFIVVAILTLMAPLIGIMYSLDKIRDNKAQSFEKWFKEYLFNVIIQSVHALLYSLFVGLALNIAGESFKGVFVAVILMMFMLIAERIFKQIFGIKSGNMTDVLKNTAGFALAGKAIKTIAGTNFKVLSKVASPVTKPLGEIHKRAEVIRRDKNIDKLKSQIDSAKAAGRTTVNIGRTSSWTHPSRIFEGNQKMDFGAISDLDSRKIAKALYEKKEAIDSADKKELSERLSQVGHTAAGIGLSAVAIPAIAVDGAEGVVPLMMGREHFKKGIKGYAKQSKNYREYRGSKGVKQRAATAAAEVASAGMYGNLSGLIRLTRDYEETRANAVHDAQYEILKKELDKKAKKEFERLLNDVSIDETELRRVYSQAKTNISEDVIQDIVFKVDAGKDSYVIHEISNVATSTSDINRVAGEINSSMKKKKKVYEFDKKEFDKKIKSSVRQDIADSTGIRAVNVTDAQIESRYRTLSNSEREKLIKQTLDGTTKLTEERMENDKWRRKDKIEHTNMNLANVNTIIDELAGETKRLNVDNFKANFEIMMKQQIHLGTGQSVASITPADVDRYISNMTHEQLIKSIKAVSAVNTSVVDDNLRKTEYDTLLDIVERAKDAEIKMKGKK